MKDELPVPPEIPPLLVSVVGEEIELRQVALRDVLSHFRNYIGETGQKVLQILRKQVAEHVTESDMQMALLEGTAELEGRLASSASVRTVEDLCESSLARLETVEAKLGKLESKVKAAIGKSKEDYEGAQAAAASAARDRASVAVAGGGEAAKAPGEDLKARQDVKVLEKKVHDLQMEIKLAKQANLDLNEYFTGVEEQLTSKIDQQQLRLQQGLELQTKSTDGLHSQLAKLGERVEPLEVVPKQLEELRCEFKQLTNEVNNLQSDKASTVALEALAASVEEFKQLVTENQQSTDRQLSSIVQRCEHLGDRIAPLEAWSEQARSQLQDLLDTKLKVSADLDSLASKAESLAAAQELQAKAQLETLEDRCSKLDAEIRAEAGRVTRLEDRHESLSFEQLEGSLKSADDVAVITDKLSLIEEGLKDKEQNVLFSARCLSCNRAYEDVAKMPGGVDLHGEKQKAQVWAEIQRALHTPRTNKTEELRVMAVKVGRPTGTKGKDSSKGAGPFASRDQSTWSYGLEDVQLLRLPSPRTPGGSGPGQRFLPQELMDVSPSSRAQTSLGMRGSPDVAPCGGLRPGTSIGLYHSPGQSINSSFGTEARQGSPLPMPPSRAPSGCSGVMSGRRPKGDSFFQSQEHGPLDFQQKLSKLIKH